MTQINKPTDYFNTKLYTGDGSTSNAITGLDFSPDWVWIKRRNSANPSGLFDVVRGATKDLSSSETGVETTNNQYGYLKSFDSSGFTVSNGSTNGARANASGGTYASWNWKAGGTASSNTDGDITSNVSVNSTAGFSIVSFVGNGGTNQTIGHGLSQKPDFIIAKNRDVTQNWRVWHKSYNTTNDIFYLNTNNNKQSNSDGINSVQDTTFTATANSSFIGNGNNVIAYCWHEVKGYSKFGTYKGTTPFVYTGFKPAMVIMKTADTIAENWNILDNKRDSYNGSGSHALIPSTSGVEYVNNSGWQTDFLSNGFKINGNQSSINYPNTTYIYIAFAEAPIVGSNNVPATAK